MKKVSIHGVDIVTGCYRGLWKWGTPMMAMKNRGKC
jgi:hypothetical protein